MSTCQTIENKVILGKTQSSPLPLQKNQQNHEKRQRIRWKIKVEHILECPFLGNGGGTYCWRAFSPKNSPRLSVRISFSSNEPGSLMVTLTWMKSNEKKTSQVSRPDSRTGGHWGKGKRKGNKSKRVSGRQYLVFTYFLPSFYLFFT